MPCGRSTALTLRGSMRFCVELASGLKNTCALSRLPESSDFSVAAPSAYFSHLCYVHYPPRAFAVSVPLYGSDAIIPSRQPGICFHPTEGPLTTYQTPFLEVGWIQMDQYMW